MDRIYIVEACKFLGIKVPEIEYVKDFRNIGQCLDTGLKIKICRNWVYTKKFGKLCRYLVIAHELIHCKQHQLGEQVDKWNGTIFKGQFVSNKEYSEMDYSDVPWEKEANELMTPLRDKVIGSLKSRGII